MRHSKRDARGATQGLTQRATAAERWGARMADSRWGWRSVLAESPEILCGDLVVGVAAERAHEAAACFLGLAQPRTRHAKVCPGRCVSRFQSNRTAKLLLGEFQPPSAQEERAVVETNACYARSGVDRLLEQRLRTVAVSGVRKPHGDVVDVVPREGIRLHEDVVSPICAEASPKLGHRQRRSVGEQLEHLVVVPARSDHDVTREHDCVHRHVYTFCDCQDEGGQSRAIAAVSDQRGGHRRGLGVSWLRDRGELIRSEQRIDHAARAILTGSRGSSTPQRLMDQSLERNARCCDPGGVEERCIDLEKRIEQPRSRRFSRPGREAHTAAENTNQPKSKCLLSHA